MVDNRNDKKFVVRFTQGFDELHRQMKDIACANSRSLNTEMLIALNRYVSSVPASSTGKTLPVSSSIVELERLQVGQQPKDNLKQAFAIGQAVNARIGDVYKNCGIDIPDFYKDVMIRGVIVDIETQDGELVAKVDWAFWRWMQVGDRALRSIRIMPTALSLLTPTV